MNVCYQLKLKPRTIAPGEGQGLDGLERQLLPRCLRGGL